MGAQLRLYRRKIRSTQSTRKITKAFELIAGSRIVKAQQRLRAATPYAEQITKVVTAVASQTSVEHPLTTPRDNPRRAALLLVTSDRGLAGGYNANAIRLGDQLLARLRDEGKEPVPFLIGRKGVGFYRFRDRPIAESWTGFSDNPSYADAKAAADAVLDAFVKGSEDGGVDEIHVVYTEFESMVTQRPVAKRLIPLAVEDHDEDPDEPIPLYEFEPAADAVLDELLPRYVESRIYQALLESAASEWASRRRAMKSASDNAEELIKSYTRAANAARQAEITQEIMEIVGGAEALAANGSENY